MQASIKRTPASQPASQARKQTDGCKLMQSVLEEGGREGKQPKVIRASNRCASQHTRSCVYRTRAHTLLAAQITQQMFFPAGKRGKKKKNMRSKMWTDRQAVNRGSSSSSSKNLADVAESQRENRIESQFRHFSSALSHEPFNSIFRPESSSSSSSSQFTEYIPLCHYAIEERRELLKLAR